MKIVCHYDEIALKGKNRPWFEKKLQHNIRFALKDIMTNVDVQRVRGRITVEVPDDIGWDPVQTRLARVFGIVYFARVYITSASIDKLKEVIEKYLPHDHVDSFAVRAKRDDKSAAITSPQIERMLGEWIVEKRGWKVNLRHPHFIIWVSWMHDNAWFYLERIPGPCGLPIGISGRALCLISGGIDSPVASYFMMKRACQIEFIHFHSFPFTNSLSQKKVCELVETLCRYRCPSRLYLVPFADVQQEIVVAAPSSHRIILYRRFMLRIAQEIARRNNIQTLVTGDNLAQVASQTMENLMAIDAATDMLVFRPLIGFDKHEIIDMARKIGTYEISIRPHDDCCSWLMPKSPELSASLQEVEKIEANLPVANLVQKALEKVTMQDFFVNTR